MNGDPRTVTLIALNGPIAVKYCDQTPRDRCNAMQCNAKDYSLFTYTLVVEFIVGRSRRRNLPIQYNLEVNFGTKRSNSKQISPLNQPVENYTPLDFMTVHHGLID